MKKPEKVLDLMLNPFARTAEGGRIAVHRIADGVVSIYGYLARDGKKVLDNAGNRVGTRKSSDITVIEAVKAPPPMWSPRPMPQPLPSGRIC